nr:MAG TPA: hypothetical protein [Caudoviricetes sp.]
MSPITICIFYKVSIQPTRMFETLNEDTNGWFFLHSQIRADYFLLLWL